MKQKRWIGLVLAALMTLSLLPASALAAMKPTPSSNQSAQRYHIGATWTAPWSAPMRSYLFETEDGMGRVESLRGEPQQLIAETYTLAGKIQSQREIEMELPIFGGFYAGADAYFFVFGQMNEAESDDAEVIRVVRYSKTWQRMDSASLYGENTYIPFDAGSLRMTEDAELLYLHEMYAIAGVHHQANLTFAVRKSDMTVTDVRSGILNDDYGYVSHSFNQYIAMDGDQVVTVDHGDAGPRAAYLYRYPAADADGTFLPSFENRRLGEGLELMTFRDTKDGEHYNATGASIGGLVVTPTHYLIAGCSIDQSSDTSSLDLGQRNVFVCAVPKDDLRAEAVQTYWLTGYYEGSGVWIDTPQIAALEDGRAVVFWGVNNDLSYRILSADGTPEGLPYSIAGALSDCAPKLIHGHVMWYVTSGSEPLFYSLDARKPALHSFVYEMPIRYADLVKGAYYIDAVDWAVTNGVTVGTSATTFSPDAECTRAQVVAFLWRAAGRPAPERTDNPFTDVAPGSYYEAAVLWAVEQGITVGTSGTTFSPDAACTRAQVVSFLWRMHGRPGATMENQFIDVEQGAYYYGAVLWAAEHRITSGTTASTFTPDKTCSRGEIVSFLYRDLG